MLQNLIKILMFLTVLLVSTSSLHLNQNRLKPFELSTINSYRRQQLQPQSSLLNDHHHYHNDQLYQTRSIRDQQQIMRSQQQQQNPQHRVIKSIEYHDDDDIDLTNSEFIPQLQQQQLLQQQHRHQILLEQQQRQFQKQLPLHQQQQQQQQKQHPRIYFRQPSNIISSSSNDDLPTSSFFNSHHNINGRFTGAIQPSSINVPFSSSSSTLSPLTSLHDYRNILKNYQHHLPTAPIYNQPHPQYHLEKSAHEKLQPISTHHLIQRYPSLPLNAASSDESSQEINDNANRNGIGFVGPSRGGSYDSPINRINEIGSDDDVGDFGVIGNLKNSDNDKNLLTSDDIENLIMLNDDVYNDQSEKYIKNKQIINNNNNKIKYKNKNTDDSPSNNRRNSGNSNAINNNDNLNSNKGSLSNNQMNLNKEYQSQPPKALQELFQPQQNDEHNPQKPLQNLQIYDKQHRTEILQSKLASLAQQPSNLNTNDFDSNEDYNVGDEYMNRPSSLKQFSSESGGISPSLNSRIKQKEQKIRAELIKRQEQLKKSSKSSKNEKQIKENEQNMQKDQQVNMNSDSIQDSDTVSVSSKESIINKKQNQNNKMKNNNKINIKQQKRQQKKELQQNKRNGGSNGVITSNIPPISHSIANQLMLRNTRGQKQYDVPQIECPSAMDGMERFACPSPDPQGRYRCIDDHVLCDGFVDCPNHEDEDRSSCMFYKTTKAHLDVLADALLRWARGR